jgi:hypothetical protein
MDFGMCEAAWRTWDTISKIITAFGLIAGGLWTVKRYFDDRASERVLARERAKSAEVEARKPFFSKQLDFYLEAVDVVGRIASTPPDDRDILFRQFRSLYLGPLALVEDGTVAAAMIAFDAALGNNASGEDLQRLAIALSRACRQSIVESWKIELPSSDAPRVRPPK